MKKLIKNKYIFIILLSILITLPIFFYSKISISHDILFHLSRIRSLAHEFELHNYLGIMMHDVLFDYDYIISLFYSNLFMYPFALLFKLTTSMTFTYKVLMLLINLITAFSIYFCLNKVTKKKEILYFGTILYMFTPYRIVDLYVRGCIGECLAFLFMPFIMLGIYEIVFRDKNKFYYLVIGMSGLIFSHVISSVYTCILLIMVCLINIKQIFKEKRYLYIIISATITLLITSSFIFPLLEQLLDRNFYIHAMPQEFMTQVNVELFRIFPAIQMPIAKDNWLPIGMGLIYLIGIIFAIKYRKKLDKVSITFLIIGIIFTILSSNLIPNNVYELFLKKFQFQWRFYLFATVSFFILLLCIQKLINKKEKIVLGYALISVVLCSCVYWGVSELYLQQKSNKYERYVYPYLGGYDYLPDGVTYEKVDEGKYHLTTSNDITINSKYRSGITTVTYSNNTYKDTTITLPLLYYKGYVTNNNLKIENNHGLVSVKLKDNEGNFKVYYQMTDIKKCSIIVSVISTLGFIIYLIINKKTKK